MANYIKKTILSESYSHIAVVELNAQQKKDFEMDIKAYQAPRARRMLGLDIEPEVRTEDGSLIVYLTVYGSLKDALGDFQDFREALQNLYTSSRMVADACNLESLYLSGGRKKDLIRAEARTGVVKATRELYDMCKGYIETSEKFSQRRLASIVHEIDKKVVKLNSNLTLARDRALVWTHIAPLLEKLPKVFHRLQRSPEETNARLNADALRAISKIANEFKLTSEKEVAVELKP